jgi:hypothetical protein
MNGPRRPFDPSEVTGPDATSLDHAGTAGVLGVARELETYARADAVSPTSGFEERVMAAIAKEPMPVPVATGGFVAGLLVAIRDAWRISMSGDRPFAVRTQAFALIVLLVAAVGSTSAVAAIGVSRLLDDPDAPPTVEPTVAPTLALPTPTVVAPSVPVSPSPSPSSSPETSEAPSATPDGTDRPTATPSPTRTPRPTAEPTETPDPEGTEDPDETDKPDETDEPDDTPEPSETPRPSETPESSDESDVE